MAQKPSNKLANLEGVAAGTDQIEGAAVETAKMRPGSLVAFLKGTINGGTSLDVVLQDSFDEGTTWNDWVTFTQLTANGQEVIEPSRPPGPDLRVKRTSVGAGWDYMVALGFEHL